MITGVLGATPRVHIDTNPSCRGAPWQDDDVNGRFTSVSGADMVFATVLQGLLSAAPVRPFRGRLRRLPRRPAAAPRPARSPRHAAGHFHSREMLTSRIMNRA